MAFHEEWCAVWEIDRSTCNCDGLPLATEDLTPKLIPTAQELNLMLEKAGLDTNLKRR